ncbi:MAG: hypothetical protein A4E70_00964 [Syntrophus sp. PtaU1.Bin005]|nr:MAG: hypothetical protein A4E69_02684 [Syntrophus sp. PtaB.Bin138]OPY81988.1 MAG: hypothetical protein A4E70_00964 [Syntrophus sp. PtaU1.Bin005]
MDRIKALEGQLSTAEAKIQNLFKAGKVPGPEDYAEIDRIKKELKTARRIKSTKEKRGETEFFSTTIGVNVPLGVREQIEGLAAAKGVTLSEYMRLVISEHLDRVRR